PRNTGRNGAWRRTIPWLRRSTPRRDPPWRKPWAWDRADANRRRQKRRPRRARSNRWGRTEVAAPNTAYVGSHCRPPRVTGKRICSDGAHPGLWAGSLDIHCRDRDRDRDQKSMSMGGGAVGHFLDPIAAGVGAGSYAQLGSGVGIDR